MTPAGGQIEALDAGLAAAVARIAGPAAEIVAVGSAGNPYATVSHSEILTVQLASGERLSIFVKHLGDEQRDHPDKRLREREARVYEELLGESGLPVPRFLGSALDQESGRLDLFLEHLDGWNLKYQGLERWRAAARDLARLQRVFAGPGAPPLDRDFLLRIDREYLLAWAGRALAATSSLSTELGRRLRRTVADLDPVAELLEAQPATLVHNDLAPKNAIADTGPGRGRTWFVDWEMAGAGCGLLDLAHLSHGLAPAEAERLFEIYSGELEGSGLLPSSGAERERLLAACRLHCTLYRLAHAESWQLPGETVAAWIAESEELHREARR